MARAIQLFVCCLLGQTTHCGIKREINSLCDDELRRRQQQNALDYRELIAEMGQTGSRKTLGLNGLRQATISRFRRSRLFRSFVTLASRPVGAASAYRTEGSVLYSTYCFC